jgi:hypothetical protein
LVGTTIATTTTSTATTISTSTSISTTTDFMSHYRLHLLSSPPVRHKPPVTQLRSHWIHYHLHHTILHPRLHNRHQLHCRLLHPRLLHHCIIHINTSTRIYIINLSANTSNSIDPTCAADICLVSIRSPDKMVYAVNVATTAILSDFNTLLLIAPASGIIIINK